MANSGLAKRAKQILWTLSIVVGLVATSPAAAQTCSYSRLDTGITNGYEVNAITSFDESTGAVQALTVFDDGTGPALYVGGRFTNAGTILANNIARWDGRQWVPLGSEWIVS